MKKYRLETALGAGLITALLAVATARAEPLADPPIPQSFGVCIHFGTQELPQHIALLKAAGFGWIRTDMSWDRVEQAKDNYDFAPYDILIGAMHDAGIRMVMILDYANAHYDDGASPVSQEARDGFSRFAATAAARYADKGVVWEIYNEPNWDFWKPKPDAAQYIALADAATAAINEAAPDAVIVGPALAGPVLDPEVEPGAEDFLGKVLQSQAAQRWNAVTVHPYRNQNSPESAAPQLDRIRQTMRDDGIDPQRIPLVAGEWGYTTWRQGADEETQAAYAVRAFLLAAADHMPFSFWYDWQNDGADDLDKQNRYGLLRAGNVSDRTEEDLAKPAFEAIKQTAALLRGYRFEKIVENDPFYAMLAFVQNDRQVFALWSADDESHVIDINLPAGSWVATHLLGDASDITATGNDPLSLTVDKMPTFIAPEPR